MKYIRGLSDVLATVLLISLTIAAVGIIVGFIVPFVNKSLGSTNCFEFRDYFRFEESFDYNCFYNDADNKIYSLTVRPQADNSSSDKIIGFDLRFFGLSTASTTSVRTDGTSSSGISMLNSIPIQIPQSGGLYSVLTYNYTTDVNTDYNKVEIYPVIEKGKICEASDSINLARCIER